MTRRRYFLRGVYVSGGIALCPAVILLVQIGSSYDGKCGGFLPALAGPKPCSFFEYVLGHALLVAMLLWAAYWPLMLTLLFSPPFVGYLLDRRAKSHAA